MTTTTTKLAWNEISVVTTDGGRVLLKGISGYAEPGTLTAIMGPSGSGKSTLLDTLAGRLSKNTKFSGQILLNGHVTEHLVYGASAFVTQDDTLIGTLTVRESVTYSARLRLPDHMTGSEKQDIVESVITDMGLGECADTSVGNWHMRGLSGGEKRRLSIALEILTRPRLIFLDEPTSGLDSASSYFVVHTLRKMAIDGRTVVASVHQPSSEVFELFDNLCLLSNGKLVYFGDRFSAAEFFSVSGFPCPPLRNPSDHYLQTINTDFDKVHATIISAGIVSLDVDPELQEPTSGKHSRSASISSIDMNRSASQVVESLVRSYQVSAYAALVTSKVQDTIQRKGNAVKPKGSHASFLTQVRILTERSFKNMRRDMGYYWLRLTIYVCLSIALGTLYFRVGTGFTAIQSRIAFMFFMGGFLTFMSIGGFPSFVEDMKVFHRERLNGHYGVVAFILGNTFSSMAFLLLISLVCSAIGYNMVKLHPGFDRFIYFVLNLFGALTVVESLMMVIASIVPDFLMGIISGAGVVGLFILVAGFFKLPLELPKVFWKYPLSYLAFHPYTLEGMYVNDFLGLEFEQKTPGLPKRSGESILRDDYQITVGRSKWWNLGVLVLMVIAYRIIFFILTKLQERRRNHKCT